MTDTKTDKRSQARDWAYDHISRLEGKTTNVYNDGHNVPTIGVGYALIVKGRNGWAVKLKLQDDFKAIGAFVRDNDIETLNKIAAAKNGRDENEAKRLVDSLDITIHDTQIRPLYDIVFNRHYDRAHDIIGENEFGHLDAKRQGVLTMGAYQSPARLNDIKKDIRRGIETEDTTRVAQALEGMGQLLRDPNRYHGLAKLYEDPDLKQSVIIHPGDTFNAIAYNHGLTPNELLAVNPHIESTHEIRAGQVLHLPNPRIAPVPPRKPAPPGRANLLDEPVSLTVPDAPFRGVDDIIISGVPEGAAVNEGADSGPGGPETMDPVLARLDAFYGDADTAATAWRASAPERASMPDAASAGRDAVDGLVTIAGGRMHRRDAFKQTTKRPIPTRPSWPG